jgi:hypothetical protein
MDNASVIAELGSSLYPYLEYRSETAYLAIAIILLISTNKITMDYKTFLAASISLLPTAISKDILQKNS